LTGIDTTRHLHSKNFAVGAGGKSGPALTGNRRPVAAFRQMVAGCHFTFRDQKTGLSLDMVGQAGIGGRRAGTDPRVLMAPRRT
jgi:hypothetical protein